jgi:hypothetical protein
MKLATPQERPGHYKRSLKGSIAKFIGKKKLRVGAGERLKNSRKLTDETRVRTNQGSKKTQCSMTLKLVADGPQDVT